MVGEIVFMVGMAGVVVIYRIRQKLNTVGNKYSCLNIFSL
jgi:hypothetical protein